MLLFGVSFVVLLNGIHYFAQLSAVRLNLLAGRSAGLEHFVRGNPYSILSAINMLGWTVFLGLASLFVAPVFSGARLEGMIRSVSLLNGLFCLGGAVGKSGRSSG